MSTTLLQKMIHEQTPPISACREHRSHNTYLHVAALVKRGKVLATAQNRIGSRSKGSGQSDRTIHAEKAVVKRLGDISELKGATLCVWRVSAMSILPSKPCDDCVKFLTKCMKEQGLRNVQQTDTCLPF